MIIDALRDKYSLSLLLKRMNISKSSYCYQHKIIHSEGKYEAITKIISQLFHENDSRYGYRRIHALLKKQNTILSEKIIRRIMKENHLVVKIKKAKKYSSYMGEITKAAENVINRDFHADRSNQKMLTDITEFSIPAGKVYLSPIIDCFDGMVSAWKISAKPNAELVNSMLDEYNKTLKNGEKPITHSDRGAHYRWPEWISRMDSYGFVRSMSKKCCSPDNFCMRRIFWKNEK